MGPAEHEEVAIYAVNQRIPNVRELREQLRCGAIRGYQVRGKIPFAPNILYYQCQRISKRSPDIDIILITETE